MLARRLVASMLTLAFLGAVLISAQAREPNGKKKRRGGTVTGVVTAKSKNWIEVKADGEVKGRRYVPHWRGGAPAKGGGLDKKMLAEIEGVPVKSRIRLVWVFEERPRVEKIEVLKKGPGEKSEKKRKREKKTDE